MLNDGSEINKILLVHIRSGHMRDHEYEVFLKHSGLKPEQIVRLDSLAEDVSVDLLDDVDAVIIGGSGDYLLSDGDIPEIIEAISKLVVEARRRRIPTLGICFGAQIIARTFGGKIEKDEARKEVGAFEITTNELGRQCPIFSELPETFDAHLGHMDHITELPEGAINLASSKLSEVQAFTFPGEPIYAFVFHPELDHEAIIYRIEYYAKEYSMGPEEIAAQKASCSMTPHATRTIELFLDKIVRQKLIHPNERREEDSGSVSAEVNQTIGQFAGI